MLIRQDVFCSFSKAFIQPPSIFRCYTKLERVHKPPVAIHKRVIIDKSKQRNNRYLNLVRSVSLIVLLANLLQITSLGQKLRSSPTDQSASCIQIHPGEGESN